MIIRSYHTLLVPRVGRRVLSCRPTRCQSHRLSTVPEDHRPKRRIHRLLMAVQDRCHRPRSRRLSEALGPPLLVWVHLSACMACTLISRSSIAYSTCPHPSPDCLMYARLPYHSMRSTSDRYLNPVYVAFSNDPVLVWSVHMVSAFHPLLVPQIESELALSVELVSALFLR